MSKESSETTLQFKLVEAYSFQVVIIKFGWVGKKYKKKTNVCEVMLVLSPRPFEERSVDCTRVKNCAI